MTYSEINSSTDVGVYDCQTGDYMSLGSGFEDIDSARDSAKDEGVGDEYVIVAELAYHSN